MISHKKWGGANNFALNCVQVQHGEMYPDPLFLTVQFAILYNVSIEELCFIGNDETTIIITRFLVDKN